MVTRAQMYVRRRSWHSQTTQVFPRAPVRENLSSPLWARCHTWENEAYLKAKSLIATFADNPGEVSKPLREESKPF